MEEPKKPRGRPFKLAEDRRVMRAFRFDPDLWAEVVVYIPKGERTQLVEGCLRREVQKRKRRRAEP